MNAPPKNEISQVSTLELGKPEDGRDSRLVRDAVPWRVLVVAVIGFWERAAFWGITAPWQNYMEHPRHYTMGQTPGALDLGQTTATRIYCGFFILYFSSPIFFSPLADSRLGQYKTLVLSLGVYVLGCLALVISSLPTMLDRGSGLPGLAAAMSLIALGGGCSQATIRSFIAKQYEYKKPRLEKRPASQNQSFRYLRKRLEHTKFSGWLPVAPVEENVIVCPELTTKFIYTVLFWVGNVGALLVFPIVYIERYHEFLPAYGLGLGCIVIAFLIILCGSEHFVKPPLAEGVMIPAGKVLTCAARNGFRMKRTDPEYQLACHGKTVTWSSQFVSEITRALGACRVLLAFFVFYICFDQMQNNLISQASDMNTGKTPNDLLPGMNQIACIVIAPLVEYIIDPALSKRRVYLRPVTRIAIGFCFVSLSMIYAGVVQHYIYTSPPCFDHPTSCGDIQFIAQYRPNVWVQAPIYVLMAAGEVFAMTTAMEFAEMHAPKDMKVLVQSINMLITGIGSAFAMIIAEAARDPYLVAFYSSLAGGMALTTVVFYVMFRNNDRDRAASRNAPDTDSERGNTNIIGVSPTETAAQESGSSDSSVIAAVPREKDIGPLPQPLPDGAGLEKGSNTGAVS